MSGKATAEALAAMGVIASMNFVGMEIRQSNAQARAAAYQSIGVATAQLIDTWAHDSELAELWFIAPAAMDAADWRAYALKSMAFARLGETIQLQIDQGILQEDAMKRLGYEGWAGVFEDPKLGCVWPLIRPGVSESYRAWVEEARGPNEVDCTQFEIPEDETFLPSR